MNFAFRSKQILAGITDITGLPDFALKRIKPKILLGYHRVLPEKEISEGTSQDCMYVSTTQFEQQVQWMQRIGEITSVQKLVTSREPANKPMFAITLDDGWKDNYDHAFPILKKYSLPAMIFLSTQAIETGQMLWPEEIFYKTSKSVREKRASEIRDFFNRHDRGMSVPNSSTIDSLLNFFVEQLKLLDDEKRTALIQDYYNYIKVDPKPVQGQILSWEQVLEMQRHNISFGSHTHSHMITKGSSRETILSELIQSRSIIEKRTAHECKWFCYPNACFNTDDHELLREAGYDYGVILSSAHISPQDSLFYLPRFIMYDDITEVLGYLKLRLLRVPFY